VLALPKPDLHLNVTSNFSVEEELFEKYLGYVKQLCNTNIEHFMQYVSLDTGNTTQAEYIRSGLCGTRLQNYVHRYLEEVPYRNSLTFIITMNNLSVTGIQSLLSYILNLREQHSSTYQRVWFDTPLLRQPAWQSLQILPAAYADKLEAVADWMEQYMETPERPFKGFKDYEVQRLQRVVDQMDPTQFQFSEQVKSDFYKFFNEHDKRRSTNFLQTFPEMSDWWDECKYWAEQ
jgi:hypothetical protein